MQEKLNIYQQYMLEIIINFIGTQPYIIMASDDDEIKKRIKELRSIDQNARYKDRIENHLW